MMKKLIKFLPLLFIMVAGCRSFPVELGTTQPLKVDISMKLDVYQHTTAAPAVAAKPENTAPDVETSRRNRMGEVQELKNSRLVGENRLGLLEVRNQPPGEYGDYVKKVVQAENSDRMELMRRMAEQKNLPLDTIQAQQAESFRKVAFQGEWVEEPIADVRWVWVQKQ